jgi:anti-sigma-K factor RskA
MKAKRQGFWYVAGSAAMIVAAIALTALINFSKTDTTTTDVRARAGANTLQLVGTVVETDENVGTITLGNVQLADESRSGAAKDLGTWIVTPPPSFSILQAAPGVRLTVTISAATFDVANKSVVATEIKVTR